jgi:hypothetical protein
MLLTFPQVISKRNSPAVVVTLAMIPARFQGLERVKKFRTQQATIPATANVAKSLSIGNFPEVAKNEDYELDFSVHFPGRGL